MREDRQDEDDEFAWIRTRPENVQQMMLRFPPSCVVRAKEGRFLRIPAPDKKGVVASYTEDEDGSVGLTVLDFDVWSGFATEPAFRAACDPDWLVVESYLGNMTPQWVQKVIDGEDIPPVWED